MATTAWKRGSPITDRVPKWWRPQKTFFTFQRFEYHVLVEHDEKHPQPKFCGNRFTGPEIWPYEYLISPIEISVNWPGSKQFNYEPGQFTLIPKGLIKYSCGHISGHHEPIHVKFGVRGFFIIFYWNMVMKMLKCTNENLKTSHLGTL